MMYIVFAMYVNYPLIVIYEEFIEGMFIENVY